MSTPQVSHSQPVNKHDLNFLLNSVHVEPKPAFNERSQLNDYEMRNCCYICGHKFSQKADLTKHISAVHLKMRPFQCSLCFKRFSEKGNLRKHTKSVHENRRPFSCGVCGSAFGFKDGLTRHLKLVHRQNRNNPTNKSLSSLRRFANKSTFARART